MGVQSPTYSGCANELDAVTLVYNSDNVFSCSKVTVTHYYNGHTALCSALTL